MGLRKQRQTHVQEFTTDIGYIIVSAQDILKGIAINYGRDLTLEEYYFFQFTSSCIKRVVLYYKK